MRVGMPNMKLDRMDYFGDTAKHKHSGNARAVAYEALSERQSSDPDIDRSKTKDNIYFGAFSSGKALVDYWEDMANEYRIQSHDGKSRRLAANAGIGFAGIIKPNSEDFSKLSQAEKIQFLRDSYAVVKEMYEKKGAVIDCAVIHVDEREVHMHYFGHDCDYRINQKFVSLPFHRRLNTEYPKKMRELGYNVEDLTGYLEETEGMTDEQKLEYNATRRKRKNGRSSKQYKADEEQRKREEALQAREAALQAREAALEDSRRYMSIAVAQQAQQLIERKLSDRHSGKIQPSYMADISSELEQYSKLGIAYKIGHTAAQSRYDTVRKIGDITTRNTDRARELYDRFVSQVSISSVDNTLDSREK